MCAGADLVISGFEDQFQHARRVGTFQTNISALKRVDTRTCVLMHTEHVDKRTGMLHRSLIVSFQLAVRLVRFSMLAHSEIMYQHGVC